MHSLLYKSVYAQQNRAFSSRRKVMSVPVAGWRGEVEIFKNGWTDERKWMNGWTKTDERMNGWTTEALFWMNGWTDERLRRMNGWTDERKWMNGWTDERKWMNGWTSLLAHDVMPVVSLAVSSSSTCTLGWTSTFYLYFSKFLQIFKRE